MDLDVCVCGCMYVRVSVCADVRSCVKCVLRCVCEDHMIATSGREQHTGERNDDDAAKSPSYEPGLEVTMP